MKVTVRGLMRDFPKVREAARRGQTVEICDGRSGETFLLTAKPRQAFGDVASSARGVYAGDRDLSTREGFDG